MRTKIRKLFEMVNELKDQEVTLMAWVRTNRAQQKFGFLNINDGSYFDTIFLTTVSSRQKLRMKKLNFMHKIL